VKILGLLQQNQIIKDKFITIIFAGTIMEPIRDVFRTSNYPFELVSLPLFSADQTETITTKLLPIIKNIKNTYQIYQLLHSFNGWPRLVSEFILLVKENPGYGLFENIENLRILIQNKLAQYYTVWSRVQEESYKIIESVAYASISNSYMLPADIIACVNQTWDTISEQGYCIITDNNKIRFPNFLVYRLLNKFLINGTLPPFIQHLYLMLSKAVIQSWLGTILC